jgi:hypothetical protein
VQNFEEIGGKLAALGRDMTNKPTNIDWFISENILTQREALEHFGFSSVLTIFGYEKSNAGWCQAEK